MTWFNYDPDGIIDIEFSGYKAQIKGRGLLPLFHGIKAKQVAWVKEADSEMQDNDKNESFVQEIDIMSPEDFVPPTETN